MNVLLTKNLAQDQLDLIQSWGWNCKVVQTLKITLVEVSAIPTRADAWIVSSRNSFATLKKFITEAPRKIYCVGEWMKNEIEKLTDSVSVKSFENMKSLATELSKENFPNVIYLCGNEHRQELEEGMKRTDTKITKLITHKSEMSFPVIEDLVDAVFVFSPRSAESLLKNNSFSQKTIFACIGSTTANYLHGRGIKNTFVASYPDSGILLKEFHRHSMQSSNVRPGD